MHRTGIPVMALFVIDASLKTPDGREACQKPTVWCPAWCGS
jgi:hypothetical protein